MKAAQAVRNGSKKTEAKPETKSDSNVLLKTLIAFKRGDFSIWMR
jgi:hypothetical protein